MRHALALFPLLACARHAHPEGPAAAPVITCELSVETPVRAPNDALLVHVTLRNAGRSRAWVVRQIDTVDADWIVDGRGGQARHDDALAALGKTDADGVSFSGPTGEGYGLADFVALAPGQKRTYDVQVFVVLAQSSEAIGDVDLSGGTLLSRALEPPGRHQLGLTVRSYPGSEYHRDDDPPYDTPWQARCAPVELETRPR